MASPAGRGAQVRLDGGAQAAARGALGLPLIATLEAKRVLEYTGAASDGSTRDGSTRTGTAAEDEVLAPAGDAAAAAGLDDTMTAPSTYGGVMSGSRVAVQDGTSGTPSTIKAPLIAAAKYLALNYNTGSGNVWDRVVDATTVKTAGDAYAAAITGTVRHNGGDGQMVGLHGRGYGNNVNSEVFGVWAYVDATGTVEDAIALEINVNNSVSVDPGWRLGGFGNNNTMGLIISTADSGTVPVVCGQYFASQQFNGAYLPGFYTGIRFNTNAIAPSNVDGNGEVMLIRGADTAPNAYKGIRVYDGNMLSLIETRRATFSRGIMEMAAGQYLAWNGSDTVSGAARLTATAGGSLSWTGSVILGTGGDRTIQIGTRATASAGHNLTVKAGDAGAGTDLAGGTLQLEAGASYGSQGGGVEFYYYPSGGASSSTAVTRTLHSEMTTTGRFRLNGGGSAALPAVSFSTDSDTGLYRSGTNEVSMAGGGVQCAAFTAGTTRLPVLTAAPSTPANGMLAYADGTSWNPGSGAGFYGYQAGAWVKL